jgi:hypothetical protein
LAGVPRIKVDFTDVVDAIQFIDVSTDRVIVNYVAFGSLDVAFVDPLQVGNALAL